MEPTRFLLKGSMSFWPARNIARNIDGSSLSAVATGAKSIQGFTLHPPVIPSFRISVGSLGKPDSGPTPQNWAKQLGAMEFRLDSTPQISKNKRAQLSSNAGIRLQRRRLPLLAVGRLSCSLVTYCRGLNKYKSYGQIFVI